MGDYYHMDCHWRTIDIASMLLRPVLIGRRQVIMRLPLTTSLTRLWVMH